MNILKNLKNLVISFLREFRFFYLFSEMIKTPRLSLYILWLVYIW